MTKPNNPPMAPRIPWDLVEADSVILKLTIKPDREVRCDQTGEVYPSIQELARQTGLDRSSIIKQMQGRRDNVKGYTFTRVDTNQ